MLLANHDRIVKELDRSVIAARDDVSLRRFSTIRPKYPCIILYYITTRLGVALHRHRFVLSVESVRLSL